MSIVGPMKIRAQLLCGDEAAIGPGKALVLEAIDRAGSISGAGRDLGMSYRRIWLLVDSLNRCWDETLVDTVSGGRGGAHLTAAGRFVLAEFRAMEERMADAARGGDYGALIARLRTAPLAPTAPSHPQAAKRD